MDAKMPCCYPFLIRPRTWPGSRTFEHVLAQTFAPIWRYAVGKMEFLIQFNWQDGSRSRSRCPEIKERGAKWLEANANRDACGAMAARSVRAKSGENFNK